MTNIFNALTYAALALVGIAGVACRITEDRIEARAAVEGAKRIRLDVGKPRGKRYGF